MRRLIGILLLTSLSACVPPKPPVPPQPPVEKAGTLVATVRNPAGDALQAGDATLSDDFAHVLPCTWGGERLTCDPGTVIKPGWQAYLRISGIIDLEPYEQRIAALPVTPTDLGEIHLESAHYDPSNVPLRDLARIRGAMWTETWNCDLGPRPWQDNNICATDFLWNYSDAQRLAIVQNLRNLGYTHAVIGPLVDSDGYHGAWTPNNWTQKWDQFLDMAQYLWDHGLAPVVFIHPDNWTLEQVQAQLTPLLQQPRAQKLLRIIVPFGWEPCKYECSSYTWAAYGQWGRQTLPNALVLLHTVCDVDAPVGTDSRGDDNGKDNAIGWQRVAPYFHGWLTQTCTWQNPDGYDDPPYSNFQNWTRLFNPSVRGSYQDRFRTGYAGWPTFSAWGNAPLDVYAGEDYSYPVFWQNGKKETARQWGDAAMAQGASGYLDGGTVSVGGPVPWQVGR